MPYKTTFSPWVVLLIIMAVGCADDGSPVNSNIIKIGYRTHTDDLLFAGVVFNVHLYNYHSPDHTYHWSFGDGTESVEEAPSHIYTLPGKYEINLILNGSVLIDTVVEVIKRPPVFGSAEREEIPHMIFQDNLSNYHVLYFDQTRAFRLLTVSSTYDSLETSELQSLVTDGDLPLLNSDGNLLFPWGIFSEFNNTGDLLKQETVLTSKGLFPFRRVIPIDNGYRAGGYSDGKILIVDLNKELQVQSERILSIEKPDFICSNFYFETPDILRIHYKKGVGVEHSPTIVLKRSLEGQVIFEKNYPFHGTSQSFKINNGYILAGVAQVDIMGGSVYQFSSVDSNGEVVWRKTLETAPFYPGDGDMNYENKPQVAAYEINDSIFIFFANTRVLKLTQKGEVIFDKRFSIPVDKFYSVTINDKGNFVLLSSHQSDYADTEHILDGSKRDLIIIEVDGNGHIVN